MRGGLVALGALLVAVGAGVLGYELTRDPVKPADRRPQLTADLDAAASRLDRDIVAARSRVGEQARKIAAQQIVRGIVVTDETSANDALASIEIELTRPGEFVEIGQRAGPRRTTLFVQPKTDGMPSPRDGTPARYTDLIADRLWLSELAEVVPRKMRDANGVETEYTKDGHPIVGYVMVSRAVDLGPMLQELATTDHAGYLELAGERRAFGTVPVRGSSIEKPLTSLPDARMVMAVPIATPVAIRSPAMLGAGGTAAGLGMVVVLLGLARPRPRSQPRPSSRARPAPRPKPDHAANRDRNRTAVDPAGPGIPFEAAGPSKTAPAHPGQVRPGTVIGRWEVVRKLGGGGMAEVFLAQGRGEGGFEKQVAIKVMHPHLARDQRTIAHFLDEARLAAGITHQNVVAIFDLGRIGDDYFIVMEYIDGLDLERLLASARAASRSVPVNIGLGILRRICDGLTAAHQATSPDGKPLGIIHRDVKSANVLISRQGAVKVVDFGIAKASAQLHNSLAGETKGTPAMMAPEQRVGGTVDVRVDVYSVGALAYEILTGRPVNVDFMALAHLGVENWPHLPTASTARPGLPVELDDIVFGAMAFERERRPADCAVLEEQLERVMLAHSLVASDKDIARWIQDELRHLGSIAKQLADVVTP